MTARAALLGGGTVLLVDGGFEVLSYQSGSISHGDLKDRLVESSIRAGAVGGATGIMLLCTSSPPALLVGGIGVAAWCAADYGINIWKDHYGHTPLNLDEFRGILPPEVIAFRMPAHEFIK